ncbi:MAG: mannose-1-phosphate guanylyltransferase [Planctomycetes bacterium]|nr:mannose-1-phosphate guanylyltransferase [Planctomycetota bacterium]
MALHDAPPLFAVLLSGGIGTRFWPASRRQRPKQYLHIVGESSMLAETRARLEGIIAIERVLVVTTRAQVDEVRAALPDLPAANVIVEPVGRNTAACIALAAAEIRRRSPRSVQVVLPADHVIRPREAFQRSLRAAVAAASSHQSLFVFGVHPAFPATSFGWIKAGLASAITDGIAIHAVERFVEKPDLERARGFLEQGGHYWNSGMFVWSSAAIERAFADHLPQVWSALDRPLTESELEQIYPTLPSVSLDVGVLERASNVCMLPIDYFWSDVGSWDALATVHTCDAVGNVKTGGVQLVASDSQDCIVHGERGSLVALLGVDNLVVVHSGSVTLVCRKERAQDVRMLVERVEREAREFL